MLIKLHTHPWAILMSILLLSGLSHTASAKKNDQDCKQCFSTSVENIEKGDGCITVSLLISADSCKHALSHFVVEIPCGEITEAANSEGWKMELHNTDPSTGLNGLKVDDITDFGEEGQPATFSLTYTVCSDNEECLNSLLKSDYVVGYKAGQCVSTDTLPSVSEPLKASLNPSALTCAGTTNASITTTVEGGTPPYQFNWNPDATTPHLENIGAGHYTVTITDANDETITLETDIIAPEPINIQASTTPSSCGNNNGSITLTVTGGTAPYSYSWSNDSITKDLTNLTAGYYAVTVADANGCTQIAGFNITEQSTLWASLSTSPLACHQEGQGHIETKVSGGEAPYSFNWSTGDTTQNLSGLNAGYYSVTITDANGCSIKRSVSITQKRIYLTSSVTPPTCEGEANGSASVGVINGTEPYLIEWSTGDTTLSIDDLKNGEYYWASVTDANGCFYKRYISIPDPQPISFTATFSKASCNQQDSTIVVNLTPQGGTPPYLFHHDGQETGASFTVDKTGDYTITMTDGNGCSTTQTIHITRPDLTINVSAQVTAPTCEQPTHGAAQIDVSGGTEPYSVNWPDGTNQAHRDNLEPGQYNVVITDASGCEEVVSVIIPAIQVPSVSILSPNAMPECQSTNNLLEAETTHAADFQWRVNTISNDWYFQDTSLEQALYTAGSGTAFFTLEVTSPDGCTDADTITIYCMPNDSIPDNGGDEDNGDDDQGHNPDPDCNADCFSIEAGQVASNGEGCYHYNLTVNTTGDCRHDLSHLVVGILDGKVSEVSNSLGFQTELNVLDPTTQLYGFKVEDIENFGNNSNDHFNISFTICDLPEENQPQTVFPVALKAGQCIIRDTVQFIPSSREDQSITVTAYPNPFTSYSRIELVSKTNTSVELSVFDLHGNLVETLYKGEVKKEVKYEYQFTGANSGEKLFFYRLITPNTTKQGKLLKAQ
ncbi:hypothetical protein DMA11_00010 [Marinilabiliaceae bacterium JC017]|nr:hypothetical protein DMA11_00010 [Marinilabiliaceae bacterium JC017]